MRMRGTFTIVAIVVLLAAGLFSLSTTRAGADEESDIEQMVSNAKTPTDHEAIAAYYDKQAAQSRAKSAWHKRLADRYRNFMRMSESKLHCDDLAKIDDRAAEDYTALAGAHRAMAQHAK